MRFVKIQRQEFLTRYFHYSPDEHVLILGPTGSGKTQMALDALSVVPSEKNPAIVFAMKPRDKTLEGFAEKNEFQTVGVWPPPISAKWKPKKPRGYLLKPSHNMRDIHWTRQHQHDVFQEAIIDSYAKGNRILFADETYSLTNELQLSDELVTVWTKGRSMNCTLWAASQRPAFIPTWAYSQSTHFFISYDPDKRSRKRYEEISGVDPDIIREGTEALDEFEWLYVKAAGRRSTVCIVSK
jgi:energy-coupling factor transporter ATP-binding protein EcfA2